MVYCREVVIEEPFKEVKFCVECSECKCDANPIYIKVVEVGPTDDLLDEYKTVITCTMNSYQLKDIIEFLIEAYLQGRRDGARDYFDLIIDVYKGVATKEDVKRLIDHLKDEYNIEDNETE